MAILIFAALYYLLFLMDFGHGFQQPPKQLDLVFNSMLDHLVRGRFGVDPAIVGLEGFTRNGQVIAYWGVFPALLRIPLMVFDRWLEIDVTLWSCLAAILVALFVKLWTVRIICADNADIPRWLVAAVVVMFVFSGAQMGYLRASVFQEVCLWGGVFGSVFVAAAMRGIIARQFGGGVLAVMALAAGLSLLTRVSIAVGLYAGIGLLLAVVAIRSLRNGRPAWRTLVLPIAILVMFILICGFINLQRWDNPLTFADYNFYKFNVQFPDRLPRTRIYGLFNLERIPFGLMYFFVPAWFLQNGAGQLVFAATHIRLMDVVELPPSSFLLTDALLLLLAAVGARALVDRSTIRTFDRIERAMIALGLLAPPLLMLTAISMTYRYRIDFYPFFEFLAFVGVLALAGKRIDSPAWRRSVWALVVVGVIGSHVSMALYRMADFGPAQNYLQRGIVRYYGDQV
ncbi:hypothetical protein [Sphingomonas sp.]|uniref:hypothetical protein n=1 Tax=Sphingomonas sp. TaxID=28214 RepID=UPI0025EDD4DE|nr:hypothetical protein [Sphingomonas sp.]